MSPHFISTPPLCCLTASPLCPPLCPPPLLVCLWPGRSGVAGGLDAKAVEQQEAIRKGAPKPDASIASKGHLRYATGTVVQWQGGGPSHL